MRTIDLAEEAQPRDDERAPVELARLEEAAQCLVGSASVPDVTSAIREAMYREAFRRARMNVHAAARMLQVDRAAVRRTWRHLGLVP